MKEKIRENKLAWEQASKYHQKALGDFYDIAFQKEVFSELNHLEQGYFSEKKLDTLKVAHLCCNNGKEIFSLAKLGIFEAVGFDFNKVVIEEATKRAQRLRFKNVHFIQSEIGNIENRFNNQFDVILVNVGTLGWFPSLEYFFRNVSRLLKEGGQVLVIDIHPLCEILNDDRNEDFPPLEITSSYFSKKPYFNENGLDYIGGEKYDSFKSNWYKFTISELINSLIKNNLNISSFEEYNDDISGVYPILKNQKIKLPLSFKLIAEKHCEK